MTLPNALRKRKNTNPISREIVLLERNNVLVAPFTNVLGAYDKLLKDIPRTMHARLMSYSTVNRAVKEVGTYIDIPSPSGIYTIKRVPLYKFFG